MRNRYLAYFFVLLAVLFWAPNSAISKVLVADLDSIQILFFTSLFATLSLFFFVLIQKKLPIVKSYTLKDYWNFALLGFVGIFLVYLLLLTSIALLPAQETLVLFYLFPIPIIPLGVLFLKEKFSLKKILASIISVIGAIIVLTKGNIFSLQFVSTIGILFGLGAAVSHAIFSIFDKKNNYEKFTSTMFYFLTSLVLSFFVMVLFSEIPVLSFPQILGLLSIGLVVNGLGYTFWFLALKEGDTALVSNIMLLTPFLALIFIAILVSEEIMLSSILGLIIIVAGIAFQSSQKKEALSR